MNSLEKKFDEKIKEVKFTFLETLGLRTDPNFAIKIGMALGYQVALDDFKRARDKKTKEV